MVIPGFTAEASIPAFDNQSIFVFGANAAHERVRLSSRFRGGSLRFPPNRHWDPQDIRRPCPIQGQVRCQNMNSSRFTKCYDPGDEIPELCANGWVSDECGGCSPTKDPCPDGKAYGAAQVGNEFIQGCVNCKRGYHHDYDPTDPSHCTKDCKSGQHADINGHCVTCKQTEVWDSLEKSCNCKPNRTRESNGDCSCPSGVICGNGDCMPSCPKDQVIVRGQCTDACEWHGTYGSLGCPPTNDPNIEHCTGETLCYRPSATDPGRYDYGMTFVEFDRSKTTPNKIDPNSVVIKGPDTQYAQLSNLASVCP